MKKPRLGSSVYLVYESFMIKDTVVMKGLESFATDETFNSSVDDTYRIPVRYDEFGTRWFTSYRDAVNKLKLNCGKHETVKKTYENYWNISGRC